MQSWWLTQGDRLVGTLRLKEIDMFWTDCSFEPGPGWTEIRPLVDASRDAWMRKDLEAARAADESLRLAGLVLVPEGGGEMITDFLLRINGDMARFRW
ncbi:hypothetical protein [Streptomyces sp. NPDC005244]|uniref:hypothetical protein n=1 Tax=Streptomyces sp. NPDC005244 TaxID=3364708 RepID=UPI0036B950BF